ncbi:Isy1-like splicing family-domain-containing protein [Mycena vulgaris]|nr:Isy1-like splicing family-domain-containing protein [Mycena vulgaris]
MPPTPTPTLTRTGAATPCDWRYWDGVFSFQDGLIEGKYNLGFDIPATIEPFGRRARGLRLFTVGGKYYYYEEKGVVRGRPFFGRVYSATTTLLCFTSSIRTMARNQEKVHSVLYRFREAQAAELGLTTRADIRPSMASARQVAKIQDAGLTDYEMRDLTDAVNTQLREKRHWENQIVALGGANYRRSAAMLDDDGREVPRYQRIQALPGVRELCQNRNQDEDADAHYAKFAAQPAGYFGDADEGDGAPRLSEYERKAEDEEWEEACANLQALVELPTRIPRLLTHAAAGADVPFDADADQVLRTAHTAAAYLSFLSAEMLRSLALQMARGMEGMLLALRKRALVKEYFGGEA